MKMWILFVFVKTKDFLSHVGKTELPHLSPIDWRWTQRKQQPDSYVSVLSAFIDRKDSYYSIHQIGGTAQGAGSCCLERAEGFWVPPSTALGWWCVRREA